MLVAHPAKDASSPWWYGTVIESGAKGWFPHNYVEELKREFDFCAIWALRPCSRPSADFAAVKAKALFTYEGGSDEQLPFVEGDVLPIVDSSEADWWKTEKAGVIFIVPASYLELIDGKSYPLSTSQPPREPMFTLVSTQAEA